MPSGTTLTRALIATGTREAPSGSLSVFERWHRYAAPRSAAPGTNRRGLSSSTLDGLEEGVAATSGPFRRTDVISHGFQPARPGHAGHVDPEDAGPRAP